MEKILECFYSLAPQIQDLIACGETSYISSSNASGDIQLALDVQSDLLIEQELKKIDSICAIFSEEKEEICYLHDDAPFCIAYDPIDGSSLIGSNLSVGTIFGIYYRHFEAKHLVASGYILYGPRLEIVIAQKGEKGILHKRFNPKSRQWEQQDRIFLKSKGTINAPGGSQKYWHKEHKAMIDDFFARGYRLRYSGGMVPDLHQILIKGGGLFSYPSTLDAPCGKLRKLFEVFPFALIFECAGGLAIDGKMRLLELEVLQSHESCPCFFGSYDEIDEILQKSK